MARNGHTALLLLVGAAAIVAGIQVRTNSPRMKKNEQALMLWEGLDADDAESDVPAGGFLRPLRRAPLEFVKLVGRQVGQQEEPRLYVLLGAPDSGTNLIQQLIKRNWKRAFRSTQDPYPKSGEVQKKKDGGANRGYGELWKHSNSGADDVVHLLKRTMEKKWSHQRLNETVAIAVVRNPISQVASWHKAPYQMGSCAKRPYRDMGEPCKAALRARKSGKHGREDAYGEDELLEFNSTIDVYNHYLQQYRDLRAGGRFKQMLIMKYEEIVYAPERALGMIADALDLPMPKVPKTIEGSAKESGDSVGRHEALKKIKTQSYLKGMTQEDLEVLCDGLDRDVMTDLTDSHNVALVKATVKRARSSSSRLSYTRECDDLEKELEEAEEAEGEDEDAEGASEGDEAEAAEQSGAEEEADGAEEADDAEAAESGDAEEAAAESDGEDAGAAETEESEPKKAVEKEGREKVTRKGEANKAHHKKKAEEEGAEEGAAEEATAEGTEEASGEDDTQEGAAEDGAVAEDAEATEGEGGEDETSEGADAEDGEVEEVMEPSSKAEALSREEADKPKAKKGGHKRHAKDSGRAGDAGGKEANDGKARTGVAFDAKDAAASKEEEHKEEAPKEAAKKEEEHKEEAPKEAASKEEPPKEEAPKEVHDEAASKPEPVAAEAPKEANNKNSVENTSQTPAANTSAPEAPANANGTDANSTNATK